MNVGPWIVVGLCVLIAAWFVVMSVASIRQYHRDRRTFAELDQADPELAAVILKARPELAGGALKPLEPLLDKYGPDSPLTIFLVTVEAALDRDDDQTIADLKAAKAAYVRATDPELKP
jgi:hypothetical protein